MTEEKQSMDTLEKDLQHDYLMIDGLGDPVRGSNGASDDDDVESPDAPVETAAEQDAVGEDGNVRPGYDPTYWQSEHDKLRAEYEKIRTEYDAVSTIKSELETNEELRQAIRDFYERKQGRVPSNNAPIQAQNMPQRPSNYNEFDAYEDPSSDSYKYRISVQKAEQDAIIRSAQEAAQKAAREAMMAEQQKIRQEQQTLLERQKQEDFMKRKGLSNDEFKNFMEDINKTPATYDELYDYWQTKNSRTKVERVQQDSIAKQLNRTQSLPRNVATVQGQPQPEPDPFDEFFNPILREGNRGIVDF